MLPDYTIAIGNFYHYRIGNQGNTIVFGCFIQRGGERNGFQKNSFMSQSSDSCPLAIMATVYVFPDTQESLT
jgi:hypothetical protein